jgi:carboxyl-terminal processing protease
MEFSRLLRIQILNSYCCNLSKLCYYFSRLKAMIRDFWAGALMLAFCVVLPVRADIAATNRTGSEIHISPGPEDGRIAFKTAQMLEYLHFSHHPLDSTYGSQFMDFYLEALDPQHLHFLETDLADFERYRTNLDHLTLTTNRQADVTPAFKIFERFIERLQQRVAYADDLLQHEKFEFASDDHLVLNRHELPYPKDMDEAKQIWRERLRFEYLEQKLGLEDAKKNKAASTNINTVSLQTNISDLPLGKVLENAGVNTSATTNAVKSMREQIVETLTHRYHRGLRLYADWNNQDVMGVYLTALAHVYDPHSDYFNKAELDQFTINMNLALFGIGAQLAFDDGYCKIQMLLPGGPAEKSKKLAAGDRIVAVAQSNQPPVDVVEMSLNKTVQMIRGPKGTEVQLTIIPEHDSAPRKVISLIRDEIPLPDQAAKGKIIELPGANGENKRLGVIDLPSFYAPIGTSSRSDSSGEYASVDVSRLLNKFKRENVTGVILDLRRNGGGSLEEAIRLAGLFIKKGPIVQVRAADGRGIIAPDPDPTSLYDGPLIVLTSRFSASASEIVAAALQDYGRAVIVGDVSTHGKGTVQSVNYLTNYLRMEDPDKNNPGALKVTVQKFYRASGVSTQLKGVLPDIVLPTVWNYSKDIGESALEHPLECDTIPSADYDKLDLVQPYLGDLLKRSKERLETNKDFSYVYEEIEKFRKQQEDKTISLNEQQRRKEMEEKTARDKARNKERLSRKEPDQKIYTITLKQADLPGLPAPDQKTNSLAAKPIIMSGAGTNIAAVSSSATAEQEDEVAPVADADLDEAERILMDYISLLQKRALVTLNHSPL